jgi:argininosuccinate synthase
MNGLTNRNKFSKLTLALAMTRNKVVLAFSGGLDTSVCVKYLQTDYKMDVITATIDCGQDDDLDAIKAKSELLGAVRHVNIDAKKEFVNNYVAKSIRANGLYQGRYPLATALARPLIATKIMELVQKEGARYVSHGCTGKGNDQVRFDLAFHAIDPSIEILAPIRDLNLTRDLEVSYAQKNEIPLSNEIKKHSIDLNIWGRAIEGGELENPLFEVTDDVLQLVKTSAENSTEYITFEFKDGIPIAVDGKVMNLADLISYTNLKVGKHGVGLIDHIRRSSCRD